MIGSNAGIRRILGGRTAVIGDFVSTDKILPARHSFNPHEQIAQHVLDEAGPGVNKAVRASKALAVGEGFGYGSGRESAARGVKAAGIELIVAKSFGRLFYRNAINQGILAIENRAIAGSSVADGDEITFDLQTQELRWNGKEFEVPPIPTIVIDIIRHDGLIGYAQNMKAPA
jgi:3-isopropylmalate/(R)-2-methylmalate dehydratase small subunit